MTRQVIPYADDAPPDGAAVINIHHDPLAPSRYRSYEAPPGRLFIDWLTEVYPFGFGAPIVLHRNGEPIDIAEADFELEPGDVVHILVQPGGPAIGPLIVAALINAAIAAVATIAFSLIMGKPKGPRSQDAPTPDPVYSLTAAQNAARLLEPVPVLYGRMTTVPDFATQPYTFFADNEMYLDYILVIGQGEYVLHDVQVGETPVSALESDAVTYWLIGPAQHTQAMGPIETLTGIMENVVSSPEVGDQELSGFPFGDTYTQTEHFRFVAPNRIEFVSLGIPAGYTRFQVTGTAFNDGYYTLASFAAEVITTVENTIYNEQPDDPTTLTWFKTPDQLTVGPFITSKPGANGNRIMLDFVWPGGIYEVNPDTGVLGNHAVSFKVEHQQVAADGSPIGAWVATNYNITGATNTPQRRTFQIAVAAGRYRVRVTRNTPAPQNTRIADNFVWTGLRFRLVNTVGPVYGPVTLLAMRIRATNGISGQASSRVRAEVTRKLPPLGTGTPLATTSPADAFVDVMTNPVYGARRPLAEIDMPELTRLVAHWAGRAHFNGGFTQKSTVWEALTLVLQTAAATPLPLGQVMSIAQDGVKAVRRQLFTDANMTRGSLAIGYGFDKPGDNDGVEVEYRDPDTFNALYATYPAGAQDPDRVTLFGGTDAVQAGEFAKLLWNKRTKLRKTAAFETELEGLLARWGDRVGVSTALPRWGTSGVVVAVGGLELVLDQELDWTGSGHTVVLRNQTGEPSEPIAVTPGASRNSLVLAVLPPFPLFGTGLQEPTHYAFGNSVEYVRDFTVTNISPSGGARVQVEGVVYDPAVYTDTLPWMEEPI